MIRYHQTGQGHASMKSKTVLIGQPVNSARGGDIVEAAVLLCALFVIYSPLLSPSHIIGGMDFHNLVFPQVAYSAAILRTGFMPLWNWYTWGGAPLLAAWQSAVLYPPTWGAILIGIPFGLQVIIFAHLWLASLGAARLARTLFCVSPAGAILSGLCYAGSGFFLGHIEQVNSVAAIAWTPWILDALIRIFCLGKGGGQLITCTSFSLLAGHPQHLQLALFLTVFAGTLWGFGIFITRPPAIGLQETAKRFLLAAGILAASFGIAAAQVFPALELASFSERVWPYADPFTPYLHWSHLFAFVVPRFFNRLAGTEGQPVGYTEESVYVGIACFCLAAYAVARLSRQKALLPVSSFTVLSFLLSLFFALGPEGGLSPLLVKTFPALAKMRGTARALNVVVLIIACWAGCGLSLLISTCSRRWSTILAVGVPTIVAADFGVTHRPELLSLFASAEALQSSHPALMGLHPTVQSPQRLYRFMAYDADLYLDHRSSAIAERYARLQPNLNMLYEVAVADGYEEGLLPPWAYGNFLRRFNRNLRNESLDAPLLALMGVQFVLTEYPQSFDPNWWEKVYETPNRPWIGTKYSLWKNRIPTAWFLDPRTLFFHDKPAELDLDMLVDDYYAPHRANASSHPPRVETRRDVEYHPAVTLALQDFALASEQVNVRVVRVAPNGLHVRLRNNAPSRVIFCGTLCSGWKWVSSDRQTENAVVSGHFRPFALLRIPKPCELHECTVWRLMYYPFSYRVGVFISLLLLATVTALWHTIPRKPEFQS